MLRLYEREGLLPLPRRSVAGYRHYPADTVPRLLAIRQLKEVGFTLKEIAELLEEVDRGSVDDKRLRTLAAEQLRAIELRLARLQVLRTYVAAVAEGDHSVFGQSECRFVLDFLSAGCSESGATRELQMQEGP